MKTSQLTSLEHLINTFTAEINSIRHGTQQYWFDPNSNQVVVQSSTSGVKVDFVNPTKVPSSFKQDGVHNLQEDGLENDCYDGQIEVAHREEEKTEKQNFYVNQKTGDRTLYQQYPNASISDKDWDELKESLNQDNDPSKNLNKKMLELLARSMWHHVQMPQEFGYTGAILANNSFQGLMHTFIRHWDQWLEHIPTLNNLIEKLPEEIRQLLERVRDAGNPRDSGNAINELTEAMENLENETYIVVRLALLEIQMKLHDFLQRNVTSAQYLEEGMNNRGQIQVYFKVTDSRGNTGVVVVCVSEQLYPSIPDFGDRRPVRTITTVFFKTWNQHINFQNRVGKSWT